MFKKIEIWLVLLILLIFLICTILFGSLLRHHYLAQVIEPQGGQKFVELQKIAVFFAEIPHNFKRVFNSNTLSLNLSIEPKRFSDRLSGFNIYHKNKSKNLDLLLLLSRTDFDSRSQVIDLVDLSNFKILKTYRGLHEVINNITSSNNEDKKNYILKENSIMMSPYLDKSKNLIFVEIEPVNICSFKISHKHYASPKFHTPFMYWLSRM